MVLNLFFGSAALYRNNLLLTLPHLKLNFLPINIYLFIHQYTKLN
jgi:hypothetical protein